MQGPQDRRVGSLLSRRLHSRENWLRLLFGSVQGKPLPEIHLLTLLRQLTTQNNILLAMSQKKFVADLCGENK